MTIEVAERSMKRRHELFRKYPVIKSLAENEAIVKTWLYTWSEGSKSVEAGLVDLIMYLINAKSNIFSQLENCMQNNPNLNHRL